MQIFRPLKVSRKQFKTLLKCIKTVKLLKYQDVYAQEKVTRVEFLSVVLAGKYVYIFRKLRTYYPYGWYFYGILYRRRLVISQQSRALHIVFPHQFLDSSEWFGMSTDEIFQVYNNYLLVTLCLYSISLVFYPHVC